MKKEDLKKAVEVITKGIHDGLKEADKHMNNTSENKARVLVDFSFNMDGASVSFQVEIPRN